MSHTTVAFCPNRFWKGTTLVQILSTSFPPIAQQHHFFSTTKPMSGSALRIRLVYLNIDIDQFSPAER